MDDHLPSIPGVNPQEVAVRPMRPSDLQVVVELDARVFGKPRAAYFERRLAALGHIETRHHLIGSRLRLAGVLIGALDVDDRRHVICRGVVFPVGRIGVHRHRHTVRDRGRPRIDPAVIAAAANR